MALNKNQFVIFCYNQQEICNESQRAEKAAYYLEGANFCDGSESERYMNLYLDLVDGKKICRDIH